MGIKCTVHVLLGLALSCLFDDFYVHAVAIDRQPVVPYTSIGGIIRRADDARPIDLAAVSRSTLGLPTDDPTLQKQETWYWGVDCKSQSFYWD
jgi:hypothetical protein